MTNAIKKIENKVDGWATVTGVMELSRKEQLLLKHSHWDFEQLESGAYLLYKEYFPDHSLLTHLKNMDSDADPLDFELEEYKFAIEYLEKMRLDTDEDLMNHILRNNAMRTGNNLIAFGEIRVSEPWGECLKEFTRYYGIDGMQYDNNDLMYLHRADLLKVYDIHTYLHQ